VRAVAALPAAGLLTGAAIGLFLPSLPPVPILSLIAASAIAAWWSWRRRRTRALIAAVLAGFVAGGAILSADAWRRAWRPPLRIVFEDLARVQRRDGEAAGRRLPIDDEVFAIVEGVLRADASESASGVALSIDVDVPAGGGIVVTVVGDLAKERLGDWRAGRRVRVPAQLHRAARYLDPGVPDHERALARRGTTLVGAVKSGALVEILARGSLADEAIGGVRAFARRVIADAVGRWSTQSAAIVAAIVIGDRAGLDQDVQRRLQEAGTYHVIAISGGNIAILAGLLLGAFRFAGWLGRTAMLLSIALLLVYARLVGNGASVDRARSISAVRRSTRWPSSPRCSWPPTR
jgi:predicted membrane metal-binding protein